MSQAGTIRSWISIPSTVGTIIGAVIVTVVGAAGASRLMVGQAVKTLPRPSQVPEQPAAGADSKQLDDLRSQVALLAERLTRLEAEAMTMEEFNAYVHMDGDRRERLISAIGEMKGQVAQLARYMRE